ncbi:MAG: hypothetical protein M1816_005942 [Peltula sp. TS41687]|nr:MAG: hypothetical protein M1816_005942 [Peltula sp. TS41687]
MEGETLHLPPSLGQLQPTDLQAIHHHEQVHPHAHSLVSQLQSDLNGLDGTHHDAFPPRLQMELSDPTDVNHHLQGPSSSFEQGPHHPFTNGSPDISETSQTIQPPPQAGQFGILKPGPAFIGQDHVSHATGGNQQERDLFHVADGPGEIDLKIVPDPPDLQSWRQRLFDVNETITLTEEQFQTYFPHVDNVYSHRSTQRYKRKPFVSHYWDCRLKGRPPGTPKSDDPNKKKRKRVARQRDLCDVKIKITEYFSGPTSSSESNYTALEPQAALGDAGPNNFFASGQPGGPPMPHHQAFGILTTNGGFPLDHVPPATPGKYYTIQRVNGNGGNGKGDGVAGIHKHTLADSDRVKKNSVQRYLLKGEKERKKSQPQQKTYHKKATGLALATVKKHSKESDLRLFGSCFCPFVQRVWVALEVKGLPYQYIEVDPYKKPDSLLEVNPRGLVPALRHGDWGCYESTVLLEYLEDLNSGSPLLPIGDPQLRAHCRLWADHINRNIVPLFYRCLQAQELENQIEHFEELKTEISKLVDVAAVPGPFFLGPNLSFVDVQFAPWMLRLPRVLRPYRGWPDPEAGSRWSIWMDAVENHEAVRATTSTDELYLDSYQRYAENRPDTSQVARAINEGRSLP